MNESFFGQYSVFCVFGSVVGCVVVPLIAQVLQQQSMECMILSAIVLSLTAARLNKRGGSEPSKLLLVKESEKKRLSSSYKKHKSHSHSTSTTNHNNNSVNLHHHSHHENEYMQQQQQQQQQQQYLKVVEMERRREEKRLKKLRKREERLKKREEEHQKQKELEERHRCIKEKRQKQKENIYKTTNTSTYNTSVENYEKYCKNGDVYSKKSYRHGLSAVDENRPRRQQHNPQRIPRFERSRTASTDSNYSNKSYHGSNNSNISVTGSLTIGCSSLSTSCSSLSSIGSSGSSSPPLPASPPPCSNQSSAWKATCNNISPNKSYTPWCATSTTQNTPSPTNNQPFQKSILTTPHIGRVSMKFNSSSLFCTQQDQYSKSRNNDVPSSFNSGEYSLFGPQKFTNVLSKDTVM